MAEYPGVYRGIVTVAVDPLGRGRVKMSIPQLLGNDDSEWALPVFPFGQSQLPPVGAPIWVMFEAGDLAHPVWLGSWKVYAAS